MFGFSLKFTKKTVGGWGSTQGRHSKGTPGNAKCVTEILAGRQNKEVGETKFKFGQLIA